MDGNTSGRQFVFMALIVLMLVSGALFQFFVKEHVSTVKASLCAHDHHGEECETCGVVHGEDDHADVIEQERIWSDQMMGKNLLVNYGFEYGSIFQFYPWFHEAPSAGCFAKRDNTISNSGFWSLKISCNEYPERGTYSYLALAPAVPEKESVLSLSAWIKTEIISGEAFLSCFVFGEEGKIISSMYTEATGGKSDWRFISGLSRVPEGADAILVAINLAGVGDIWIDDVSLIVEDVDFEIRSEEQLIKDEFFKEGFGNWIRIVSPDAESLNLKRLNEGITMIGESSSEHFRGVFQAVQLNPSLEGNYSFSVQASSLLSEGSARVFIDFHGGYGSFLVENEEEITSQEKIVNISGEIPQGTSSATIMLGFAGAGKAEFRYPEFIVKQQF